MYDKMGFKVVACFSFLIGILNATEIDINGEWRQDIGWVVNCSWYLFANDSLQSVRLYDNDRQFMVYRPEKDGNNYNQQFGRTDDYMYVECRESVPRGIVGTCLLTVMPFQPSTKDFTYTCEVSGERPKFRIEKKSYYIKWFVPPTDAHLEVGLMNTETGRGLLNCTSKGWPAPNLNWKIGDQNVPSDFNGSFWNRTSKLWHVWSLLSYTPSSADTAVCTPEILTENISTKAAPAKYNSASNIKDIRNIIIITVLLPLMSLRIS